MKSLFYILLFASLTAWADGTIVGKWKTIDDETGKEKSIVEITKDGDEFKGRILELFNSDKPNPICDKCSGDKKDQPVVGMEIIWGMKETDSGKEWTKGNIMDPKNGKTYSCRLRLKEDGQKLEVRGFLGFSLLGRSQTWLRAE
ncbi:MAG TPA: DUF2147 domain-containing protein [Bdellovibrionales bacterium]|nr:DUF2147 domain-containing protein [Bdellovibrionales bacterium]